MKNLLNSKIVLLIFVLAGYTIYNDLRGREGIELSESQQDKVLQAIITFTLAGGGIYGRYKGDTDLYTPKGIPGRDKAEQIMIGDNDEITIE